MTAQFARATYRGRSGGGSEPHAALLIDFDNVTMGIRSDLTKELKNLLNSDIIKGKVAVQRAYADWRRYPQYIVPLAESSVDLIFAPAYGSAKKNATDIRLAIDAVELVFTRPEIGTIILLSGDSDFSSLVLKLKEYGKYVIGVGIRESASDLLVQNCDEYYSYSALTGLTRAGDESPVISEDPWELVEMALRQMIENGDVMRSDRLKQVLLEMDPSFDEKSLGFQKFNKFLQEAANRGIISVRKQENGQFEVGPPSDEAVEAAASAARGDAAPSREGRERESRRRGRRGRGRRDEREREEKPESQLELESSEGESEAVEEAVQAPASTAEPAAIEAPEDDAGRTGADEAVAPDAAAAPAAASSEGAAPTADGADGLRRSYELLRRAMSDLTRKGGPVVRDSDVKRRMLELESGWDESTVGFSKFSRFLRQAHDAQVVTLRKGDNGNFDVMLGDGGALVEEPAEGRGGRRGRGDRPDRGRGREREPRQTAPATEAEPAAAASPAAEKPAARGADKPGAAAAEAAPQQAHTPAAAGGAVGFRRGSRGRPAPSGPPPLLEGQAAVISRPARPASEDAPAAAVSESSEPTTAVAGDDGSTAPKTARKAARKAAKKTATKATAKAAGAAAGKAPAPEGPASSGKAAGGGRGGKQRLDPRTFGLPTTAEAITSYISTEYKGVGPRTVEALMERVGPERFFEVLEHEADLVRDVVGAARGEKLLETWADDIAFRRANAAPTSAASRPAEGSGRGRGPGGGAKSGGAKKGGAKSGGGAAAKTGARRSGRRGGRRGPAAGK